MCGKLPATLALFDVWALYNWTLSTILSILMFWTLYNWTLSTILSILTSREKRYQAHSCFSVLKATESWAGPGNEAIIMLYFLIVYWSCWGNYDFIISWGRGWSQCIPPFPLIWYPEELLCCIRWFYYMLVSLVYFSRLSTDNLLHLSCCWDYSSNYWHRCTCCWSSDWVPGWSSCLPLHQQAPIPKIQT